jgi:1,2-diacylglycerol 3-beta-galactosyltransferase
MIGELRRLPRREAKQQAAELLARFGLEQAAGRPVRTYSGGMRRRVVSKAGPGTIAEAACCAAPLLLTSHVPGQEEGNAEFVVGAGAGRYVPGRRDLVTEIASLRGDPSTLAAMRAASAALSRPTAAAEIAELLASFASPAGEPAAGHGRAAPDARR